MEPEKFRKKPEVRPVFQAIRITPDILNQLLVDGFIKKYEVTLYGGKITYDIYTNGGSQGAFIGSSANDGDYLVFDQHGYVSYVMEPAHFLQANEVAE